MEALDVNALPLAVPVVMASSFGATLRTPKRGTSFVELYRSGNGTIGIRNASNKNKHLCLSLYSQCSFGSPENALKFKVKEASAGRFVFEESSTGNVLEMEYQGRVSLVVCRNKYREGTQSWFVLQQHKIGSTMTVSCNTDPLSLIEVSEDECAGRRRLIAHLLEAGKSIKDVGEISTLMYGSPKPLNTDVATEALCAERRQLIVKYFENPDMSAKDVGKIVELMYGTTSPLQE